MDSGDIWVINGEENAVGYAIVNDQNQLIQFYLKPTILHQGTDILKKFISQQQITYAMIGTNNPIAFSLSMNLQEQVEVHTLLFEDFVDTPVGVDPHPMRLADESDLTRAITFCQESMGAPEAWLRMYLGRLISEGSLYLLEEHQTILGSCEVRPGAPGVAHVGMIVAPASRKSGLGTYLLKKAKEIANSRGLQPICSCELDNTGSLKCIHAAGFRSMHQILQIQYVA